jgi:lipopolysaccharide export system protein LptC
MSILPDRAARAFPLLLLALLAGLALTLDRITELPYFAPGAAPHQPDLVIQRFVATEYNPDGTPHYRLYATQMRHYPDDHAELDRARMHRTEPGAADMTVTADLARMNSKGNEVWFDRNVLLQSAGQGSAPPIAIRTSRLQLNTDTGHARTDAPTEAQSNGNVLRSTGFDYDHDQALLRLRSKVSIDYAPPKP